MKKIPAQRLIILAVVFLIIASTLPLYAQAYLLGLLTVAYYFGVFSMSWDLLFGYAGEVNFGPTFLMGLGAYTAGILNNQFSLAIPWCIVLGSLAAVIGGLVLALPALRLKGPYFGLTTLVAVLLLQNVIIFMSDLTGGEIGLTVPDVIAINEVSNYYIALGVLSVSGFVLYTLANSRLGLILEAIGQNPVEASALGFNVTKHKLSAFVVSAFFSGVAGAFLVFYFGSASVGTLIEVSVGVQIIIAAVLGGRRTILGAVLGSIFMIAATEALRPLGTLSTFVVSLAALFVIMMAPGGLLALLLSKREEESAP
jgi:branched-chain amino acid transport system permease protein